MLELDISVKPTFDEVMKAVGAVEKEVLADIRGAGDAIKTVVVDSWKKRFATENKGQWAPLSPKYKAWKEEHYPGRPILHLTGELIASATMEGKGHIDNRQPTFLEFGVDRREMLAVYCQYVLFPPSWQRQ